MELVHKLENTIGGWLKSLPHLPANWSKWLANNAWWIVLIGVIISIFGILGLAYVLMIALTFFGAATTFMGYAYSGVAYSTWWIVVSIVSFALLIITTVLEAMAISPLKAMKQKGWDLMFLVFLIGVLSGVVSAVVNFNAISILPNLIWTAISAVISAYVLFEVRSYFKTAVTK